MKKYNWNETNVITMPKEKEVALYTNDLHVWYGDNEAIKGVDLEFEKNKITALIGPSGCGKSTYLRSLNRMNDGIANTKITGKIMYKDVDINAPQVDVYEMRKRIGMVFQRPNPFSKSIYDNITFVNLKEDYTIIIVTHNMQQAARISDYTAFFYLGKVMEYDKTNKIFTRPKIQATEDYVSGHFG